MAPTRKTLRHFSQNYGLDLSPTSHRRAYWLRGYYLGSVITHDLAITRSANDTNQIDGGSAARHLSLLGDALPLLSTVRNPGKVVNSTIASLRCPTMLYCNKRFDSSLDKVMRSLVTLVFSGAMCVRTVIHSKHAWQRVYTTELLK